MKNKIKYLLIVYFLILLSNLFAIPKIINYQGRIVENNQLVSRQATIIIRLYDSPTNGTLLLEDVDNVIISDGLYSTFIGDSITYGSFENVISNSDVYISLEVDGQLLYPREKLSSIITSIKSEISEVSNNISNQTIFKFYVGTNLVGWGRKK